MYIRGILNRPIQDWDPVGLQKNWLNQNSPKTYAKNHKKFITNIVNTSVKIPQV